MTHQELAAALGLPMFSPEPEVAASILARVRMRSLAAIVARLINEHEPLLNACSEGSTVTVCERGSSAVMRFKITEGE